MNGSLIAYFLFAQLSRWQRLGDGIHRGRGRVDLMDFVPVLIVLALIGLAIFVAVQLRKRNDMSENCDDPEKLFRELSLAHQLDRASQKLLRRLAEAVAVTQPAEVFLQPAYFQAENLPQSMRQEAAQIEELRQQLFG